MWYWLFPMNNLYESQSHWIYTPVRWEDQPRLAAVRSWGDVSWVTSMPDREGGGSASFHNSIRSKVLSFRVRGGLWRWGQCDRWLTDCPFRNLCFPSCVQTGKRSVFHPISPPRPSHHHSRKCTGFYRTLLQLGSTSVCKSKDLWKKIWDFCRFFSLSLFRVIIQLQGVGGFSLLGFLFNFMQVMLRIPSTPLPK